MSSPEWKCRRGLGLLKLVAFLFYLSLGVLFAHQVEANVVTTTVRGARLRRLVTGSSRVECVNAQNRPLSHRIFCLNGCKSSSSTSSTPSQSASASIEPPPTVIRAKSVREFVQKCKPNNGNSNQQGNHLSQILTKTIRNETLFERRRENGQTVTVFVLDFRLVTGSVYIDFKSSSAMLKPDQQLILNVVTKQFVTFRLLNVPSRARIRVLVNGEARVSYVEKKDVNEANLASTVEIWHAPLYDRFANRSEWVAYLERSTGVYIRRYVEYLNLFCHLSHLRIDLDLITQLASGERFVDQQLVEYMEMEDPSESLLQICSLNESPTQEQSQNAMSDSRTNSLSSQDSGGGVGSNRNSAPFWSGRSGSGNPLSFLQSMNAAGAYGSFSNQNDLSFLSSRGGGGNNFRPNILDIDTYEFYMFEIEHDEAHDFDASPNHFLRLFIDECDFNKKYILILYINLKNSSDYSTPIRKKLILDDFDCPIRAVYSNAEVFDQLNLLYHQWNYLNVTKIIQDYKNANSEYMNSKTTSTNAFSDDDIRDKLAYILPYDLNFSLNNTFYYLKILKTASDIELIFLSAEGRLTLAHNKFFNKLNQQTFVSSSSSSMSNSMKFVLKEHDILEYFKENHLKLDSFLHSDKKAPSNMTRLILAQNGLIRQRDSRFFFISSHRCPVIFLNSILMVDQIDNYLLLFDSKLYDNQSNTDGVTTSNECFYYEKSTESFYATFGFAINELTFRNSFYFTIKQQLEKPKENNNKNPLYSLSSLNNIKEKAVDEYFMNVIHSTIKLNYTVQSSARLLAMSHESSALETDLWQQHNNNRHRKNRLKDDFNAKQKPSPPPTVKPPQPKPAHVELDVHIRLTALDDSIAWRLDSCWFNDNFCINKLETTMNSFDGGGGSVKPDVNYAGVGHNANSGEHYQDEFAEEEDIEDDYDDEDMDAAIVNSQQRMRDYDHVEENGWSNDDDDGDGESYYEHLIEDNPTPKPTPPPPSSTRRNRKSRNQPNMISYELKSSSISFERSPTDQLFVFSARFTLVFNPILNAYSKPYILCNMKPYAAPCSSSDDSGSSSSSSLNGSSHDSNHCDEKSSSSKAAKFMEREKGAGNKVKTIVLTQMRRAEPSNASTSEPEMKFAFDSTQHLAPNKKHRLPDCTWFVRYYNDNTNNANGSQQTKDAKNNKTANLSASSNITTTTSSTSTTTTTSTTTSSANTNTTNNNARYNATTTANTFYNTNTTISNNDDDNNNNNYNQNLPLPLPFTVSWLLDWAHANLFTIVLVVLFVVCLVGFIVLVKLVFFRDCNLCSKLVLFKKPSNGQNGSSSSAANQNGSLKAIDAEQQLSLLDHKVPDHQPPGNGNLTQSKHIINIQSTHENNHLISNRQQKSEATTNHL